MGIVLQVSICVVPAMILVALSQFNLGAYWLFGFLGLFLLYHLISRRPIAAAAVLVGAIPLVMFLRGLFLYNSLQLMLAVCFLAALGSPPDRLRIRQNKPLVGLVSFCFVYWFISFLMTGDYSSNIRVVELALTASVVFIVSGYRTYLAAGLLGIIISATAMASGLLPHGARLGMVELANGVIIGNPIAMGASSSLGYLLTIADRGRWCLLQSRPSWRLILNGLAAAALVLSTSRGSWLVTILGLVIILLMNKSGRSSLLASLCLGALLIGVILQTGRGAAVAHYFDNAMDQEKSIEKRTTGRADQWTSFPAVFNESPLYGFGPGSGKKVSEQFTKEGKVWHSLYLLIGAETGLIGLSLLVFLLLELLRRNWERRELCGEIVPLLALICYMIIGVSVSGVDAISGVFLGLSLIAKDYTGFVIVNIPAKYWIAKNKVNKWQMARSHS